MKVKEFRDMSLEELRAKEGELGKDLFNLRMRHTTAQLENPIKLRTIRRDIARIKTVMAAKAKERGS
ncbi:MAG: 50S ribosomal protein L29 [Deltaproteobacteria bacterium]|nr:50S ribosomal protein L29 [Deltaproteobacteria bacterium]MBI5810294.1 50S ribosomal protein L29 [Deltaproteobacteria bacterium]